MSKMDERQLCEQDNLSEVQLEQDIDRAVHQLNSVDILLVNRKNTEPEVMEMIDPC